MFNGQFRLHENLMYEKKFAEVNFAESLQWPIYNYLLCNKKIVGYYNYTTRDFLDTNEIHQHLVLDNLTQVMIYCCPVKTNLLHELQIKRVHNCQ